MQDISPQHANINGTKINYIKVGTGSPLVLIHGWANNWEGWMPLVSELEKNFTFYILDLPGFGDSEYIEKCTIQKYAEYVASFITSLQLEKPTLIGFSMGTFVAATTALKFPNILKSTILIGPPVKSGTNFFGNKVMRGALKIFYVSTLTQKILKKIVVSKRFTYWVAKNINMYKFNKSLVDAYGMNGKKKMKVSAFIEIGINFSLVNLTKVIEDLKIPTLLLFGRQDKIAPPKYATSIVNENVKVEVLPRAGHMVFWEKPKESAERINIFLKS